MLPTIYRMSAETLMLLTYAFDRKAIASVGNYIIILRFVLRSRFGRGNVLNHCKATRRGVMEANEFTIMLPGTWYCHNWGYCNQQSGNFISNYHRDVVCRRWVESFTVPGWGWRDDPCRVVVNLKWNSAEYGNREERYIRVISASSNLSVMETPSLINILPKSNFIRHKLKLDPFCEIANPKSRPLYNWKKIGNIANAELIFSRTHDGPKIFQGDNQIDTTSLVVIETS